jgi:hypothetical protein
MGDIETFLSSSAIARRARLDARIVFRTGSTTPRRLHQELTAGEVELGGDATCELVAGGKIIATGSLVERDGRYYFEARNSNEAGENAK